MSSALTRHDRPGLPVAPARTGTAGDGRRPEPAGPNPDTLEASTTYDPHDRVPLADAESEC
ncbi:MAG: hypothetical protein ACJ8GN_04880 [Longimicrobiaceae bacterium]